MAYRRPAVAVNGGRPVPARAQLDEGLARPQSRGTVRRPRDRLPDGFVFTADTPDGPTAAVLVAGDGATMSFRPAPETEREQVRIYAGSDSLDTRIDEAFLRFSPTDFQARLPADALVEAAADPAMFRRAEAVLREEVGRSFSLDLADLSRETWSLPPASGDFLAEIPHAPLPDADLFEVGQRRGGHLGVRPAAAAQHLGLHVGGSPGGRRRPLRRGRAGGLRRDPLRSRRGVRSRPAVAGRPRAGAPEGPRRRHQQPDAAPGRKPHGQVDLQHRVRPPALVEDPRPEQRDRQPQRVRDARHADHAGCDLLRPPGTERARPRSRRRRSSRRTSPRSWTASRFPGSRASSIRRARSGIHKATPATTPPPSCTSRCPRCTRSPQAENWRPARPSWCRGTIACRPAAATSSKPGNRSATSPA